MASSLLGEKALKKCQARGMSVTKVKKMVVGGDQTVVRGGTGAEEGAERGRRKGWNRSGMRDCCEERLQGQHPYLRPAQAKILKIVNGHREHTHGGAPGSGNEPTQTYTRSWTNGGGETTSTNKVGDFFGRWCKAGGTVSALVSGSEGEMAKKGGGGAI